MAKKSNILHIKKIPLEGLLEILGKLYNDGVDYIDIYGDTLSPSKDVLKIGVRDEYYSEDSERDEKGFEIIEDEEDIGQEEKIVIKHLTDDYLNDLM